MIKNNVKENLFDDEENIYVGLSDLVNLRESAELREAANAFESYLVNYAQVAHMPQSVLSDICRLSVEAAHRGMEFCFTFITGPNKSRIITFSYIIVRSLIAPIYLQRYNLLAIYFVCF